MRPLVMGILNVTPDSFSDGGHFDSFDSAVARGHAMREQGADIVDVGGESTRPGAEPVSPEIEITRVVPIIKELAASGRVSVDTRSQEVAVAAVDAGATIINDVSAELGPVAARLGVGWVAMHMQGDPRSMQQNPRYGDVKAEIKDFLVSRADRARAAGAPEIWIDPGIGFGKTMEHNITLLAHVDELVATGYPVAVGTSRKGFVGRLHAHSDGIDHVVPVSDRLEGSLATATYAMTLGASMIRVHDVGAHWQAAMVVAGASETPTQVPEEKV